jgi:hypothetical protein
MFSSVPCVDECTRLLFILPESRPAKEGNRGLTECIGMERLFNFHLGFPHFPIILLVHPAPVTDVHVAPGVPMIFKDLWCKSGWFIVLP